MTSNFKLGEFPESIVFDANGVSNDFYHFGNTKTGKDHFNDYEGLKKEVADIFDTVTTGVKPSQMPGRMAILDKYQLSIMRAVDLGDGDYGLKCVETTCNDHYDLFREYIDNEISLEEVGVDYKVPAKEATDMLNNK